MGQAGEEARCPPVVFAKQVHDGGDEEHADDGGVDKQGENHAEGDVLHHHDVGEAKGACDHNHDERGRRNDAAGVRGTRGDGLVGGSAPAAGFHHARDQEDLVVGRQTEDDGDDEHQNRAHERAGGEVEQSGAEAIDEHERQDAQRGTQGEQRHDDGLERQDEATEDQRHEEEGGQHHVKRHPGQRVEERVEGFDLHGRGAADIKLHAFWCLDVLELVDDARVVLAVLDAGAEDGGAVDSRGLRTHRLGQPLDGAGLHDDVDKLLIGRVLHHELDWLGAEGGELLVELVLRHARVLVGRQVGLVDTAELHAQHRQGQRDEQRADGGGHHTRAAHGPARHPVPPRVLDAAPAPRGLAHGPLIDVGTQHAKERGQHRHRQQRGETHRGDRAVGHGFEEGLREEEKPGEGHGHHGGGEDHGLAGSSGGNRHRFPGIAALVQLLTEARNHEQAIVDGQAQAQQRDDGLRKHVDLLEASQDREDAQRAQDGQATHDERHESRHDGAEDNQQ